MEEYRRDVIVSKNGEENRYKQEGGVRNGDE